MPDAPEPKTERLGERYALYGEIASGGMATVHFGRLRGPVGFARTVAIKRLHSQYASEPDFVSMFVDEARLAARVRHPNVVATIDVVASENLLYLVMEYVQGESLAKLARACVAQGGRVPRRIATAIMLNMLQGLHAAHEAKNEKGEPLGIVHRDVSPQNVLVGTDGVARVIDFGIAKAASRASVATETGQMKGKPAYMSPEQILDKSVTRLADIYAASVVYWELLTGERLFLGKNDVETINRVLKHPVEPPSSKLPSLLPALDQIVLRGLERDPAKRYATAREMARAIEECIAPASSSDVGEWVEKLAGEVLATRERRLKEIEDRTSFGPPSDDVQTTIGPPPALVDTLIGARTRSGAPMRRDPNLADTLDPGLSETHDENPIESRNRALAQTQRQNLVRTIPTVPDILPGPPTLSAPSTEVSTPLGQTLPAPPRPMAFPDLNVRTGRADADRLSIPTPGNLHLPPTGRHLMDDDDDDDDDMDPEAETRVQPSFELDLGARGLPHTSTQSTQGVANTVEVAAEARPARRSKGWVALPLVLLLFACAGIAVYRLPGYVRARCIAAAAREGIVLGVQTVTLHPHGIVLGGVTATVPDMPFAGASASELEVALSGLTPQGVSARGFELSVTGPLASVVDRTTAWRAAHEGKEAGRALTLLAQSGHIVWAGIFGEGTQLEVWDASVSLSSDGPRDLRLVASSLMVHTPRANLGPWSAKLARDATSSRLDVAFDPSVPEWATLQATSTADGKGTVGLVVPRSSLARVGLPPELLGAGSDASTQIEARLDIAARPRTEGRATVSLFGVHTSRGVADAKVDVAMTGEADPWTTVGTLTVGATRGRVTGTVARPGPGFRLQLLWKPLTVPCDAEPAQDAPPDDHGVVSPAPPSPRRHGRGAANPSPPPFQPAPAAFVGGPGGVTITFDARDVGSLAAIPSSPHCLLGVLPLP